MFQAVAAEQVLFEALLWFKWFFDLLEGCGFRLEFAGSIYVFLVLVLSTDAENG